jgi:hypothetical protein
MLAASDCSLKQSQTKEFWDLFASFQKGVRCIRHTPALGKWGAAARVSSAPSNGTQFLGRGPKISQMGPYVGKGTHILQMGPVV